MPMDLQGNRGSFAHTLAAGRQLQAYRLNKVLGEGGFGIVYLAEDGALQRQVAIKEYLPSAIASRAADGSTVVVKSEDHTGTYADGLRSFLAEARMLVRFEHPALVKVHQFWEENGTAYMVMPHYAGPTLKRVLAAGAPPSEAEIRHWLLPLLDALEVLHADHCIHRDIAPDNIIITPQGPVLLDFGAARRVVGELTHALTAVLKPGYAPIEQYGSSDDMQQGPWTDLFALASVLYLAVAGVRPPAAVDRLVVDRLRPLSQVAAGRYTPAFLAAVDSAMAVLPEYRPRSVAAFRMLLDGRAAALPAATATPVLRRGDAAPAAVATSPNNLPRQRTSFVGRDDELAELAGLLQTAPLVTVLGMGGLGKTRLTLQVAARLLPAFPDGAWFLDLSAITDPALVVGVLARALDVADEPGRPLIESVCAWLAPRRALLVVDNCEHLLQAVAELVDVVLGAAPRVQVLASSRQLLDVPGEQAYPLRPLPLPDETASGAVVLGSAAVRMFIDRARAHRPDFQASAEDAPLLAQVLHRLEGIPLAIELAAAKLRTMAVAEILSGLDRRYQLLAGGSRLLAPRQQNLQALVDWSYDLLADDERAVFQQLSLFAGGFDTEAVQAVCGADAACITSLVQKSLVMTDGDETQPRYRLLETLRDYARDKLVEAGAEQAAAARHCAHYFALAKDGARGLHGADQGRWVRRLDTELDNLRAAAACAQAGHADPLIAVKLAVALTGFWILRGHTAEGLRTVDAALTLPQVQSSPMAQAWALYTAAALASSQGDHAPAAARLHRCLALRRTLGNPVDVAATLSTLALAQLHAGDAQQAATHEAEALALFAQANDGRGQAIAHLHLGQIHLWTGDAQEAQQELTLALALAREIGHREVEAEAELTMAEALLRGGQAGAAAQAAQAVQAEAAVSRSLAICREAGDQRGEASATWWLGRIALHQGRVGSARPLLQQALQDFAQHELRAQMVGCLDDICELAIEDGDALRGWTLAAALEQARQRLKLPRAPWAQTRWQALLARTRLALLPTDAEAAARNGRSWDTAALLHAALVDDAEQTRLAG